MHETDMIILIYDMHVDLEDCVFMMCVAFFEEQRHGDKETYINTEGANEIAKQGK